VGPGPSGATIEIPKIQDLQNLFVIRTRTRHGMGSRSRDRISRHRQKSLVGDPFPQKDVPVRPGKFGSLHPTLLPPKVGRLIQESGDEPYQRDFWPLEP
jgi:hypothetical protein